MKTQKQIEGLITQLETSIEYDKEFRDDEFASFVRKINTHADNAAYVAEWAESWMSPVVHANKRIESTLRQIQILKWTLKGEEVENEK